MQADGTIMLEVGHPDHCICHGAVSALLMLGHHNRILLCRKCPTRMTSHLRTRATAASK